MKKILLSLLCGFSILLANAQSQFGILSYTVPDGWVARQSGDNIELVKNGDEKSGCKIILYKQLNSVVSTQKGFSSLWASKTLSSTAIMRKTATPSVTKGDGWISFAAYKTIPNVRSSYTENFYTMSDSSVTAVILTWSNGTACSDEIQSFLESIEVTIKESGKTQSAKTKKTKFPYVYR